MILQFRENIILQNEGKIFKLSGDVAKKYLPNKYELVDESDYYEAKMGSDGTNFNVVVSVKEKSKVKVRFDLDGGNLNGVSDIEDYPGFSINDPGSPSKENYKFVKWVDENGKEVIFPYTVSKNTTLKVIYEKVVVSEGYEIGDENYEEYSIITKEYKDNSVKSIDLENVPVIKDSVDVTNESTFEFYSDSNKEERITTLDFPNGGTTKKVFVVVKHNGNTIEKDLYIKLASVTIGKQSSAFMTIEDALANADTGDQIVVKYNTSFASADIAQDIYGTSTHEVKKGVTLLLPFDNQYSDSIKNKATRSAPTITRNKAFVELNMPENINLNIYGIMTINAKIASAVPHSGYVNANNYSQLKMEKDSKITVNSDGVLNSIGFIYGEGSIETMEGSKVLDLMMIHDFRGGGRTFGIYSSVFPFNQFSANNIEVPIKINANSQYNVLYIIEVEGANVSEEIELIGNEKSLIGLDRGYIIKSYNSETGKMVYDTFGKTSLNNLSMKIKVKKLLFFGGIEITASTKGKDIPLSGFFEINIKAGSTLDVNASLKMLPGSKIQVDQGATMNINQGGKIFVYNSEKLSPGIPTSTDGHDTYPRSGFNRKYRVAPVADFTANENGHLIINGNLNVLGAIGGPVVKGENGTVFVAPSANTTVTIKEVSYPDPLPVYTLDLEIIENQVNP